MSFLSRFRLVLLALASALVALPSTGEALDLDEPQLDALVSQRMRQTGIPALAVAIVEDGQVRMARGWGTGSDGQPITDQTPFFLGAPTEALTALAVLQQADAGLLDIEAPVRRYLPSFATTDPRGEEVLVRHLLHHTSGIAAPNTLAAWAGSYRINARPADLVIAHAPGTRIDYSPMNYVLLGEILERVTDVSFEDYLHDYVFAPLEMNHSYALREEATKEGLAIGHQYWFGLAVPVGEPRYDPWAIPAGFVAVSAHDMGRFLALQLGGRTIVGSHLLSRRARRAMFSPHDGRGDGQGMGWEIRRRQKELTFERTGCTGAFCASMIVWPRRELGVVVLSNVHGWQGHEVRRLRDDIVAQVHGETPAEQVPWERIVRAALLLVMLTTWIGLIRSVLRWFRAGQPLWIATRAAILVRLAVALAIGFSALFAATYASPLSLAALFDYQPDIAWGGSLSVAAFLASAIFKAMSRSRAAAQA